MQAFHNYFSRVRALLAALGIMLFLPAGRHGEDLALIDSPITQELFEKYKYLFSNLSIIITPETVFMYENLNFHVLRITNKELCQNEFCFTFIVNRCNRESCPHATALAPNRFYRYIMRSVALGELARFPTPVDGTFTTIMINSRFVAAAQAF